MRQLIITYATVQVLPIMLRDKLRYTTVHLPAIFKNNI